MLKYKIKVFVISNKNKLKMTLDIVSILYIMSIYKKKGAGPMEIILSNVDGTPIYEQIVRQIKSKIVGGELQPGEALPSMRLLAKELRISVITTKRAYEELEREGFIYTVTGKGSFVAKKNLELIREENLKKIEEHMNAAYGLAAACGLSKKELLEMFALLGED